LPPVPPGTALLRELDQFGVQCGDGTIAILGWRLASTEAYRRMQARGGSWL
jgi:hypothetical protein